MSKGRIGGVRVLAFALLLVATVASGAELPPEIAVDRLLVRAEWQANEGRHREALATLNEVLALVEEEGLAAPEAFWFRHAQAASVAAEHVQAVASATRYLTTAGRDGAHYRAALELLETSDREVRALREREAAERAEQERRQVEARAEQERRQVEARAYRDLRESAAASPGALGDIFADALQSGGRGPAMVVIPAGAFQMGCLLNDDVCDNDEQPVHEVTIGAPFALSVYEATFAEWDACVAAGGCDGYEPADRGWGRGARPVINVSWDDAQQYVAWLSLQTGAEYRLPSESEWEYAARAGTTTRYSWGDEIGVNRANCDGCGSQWDDRRTAPVGSFRANGFGVHDLHGNVWEWVTDCRNDAYRGAPSDGSAWLSGNCEQRVLRGGSWNNDPRSLRAANRLRFTTDDRYVNLGFRVARTLTP